MPAYTALLRKPLVTISWEDDNFIEELLRVAVFRFYHRVYCGTRLSRGRF